MIYIVTINVPNRERWGGVFSKDVVLPRKVKRINGWLGVAELGQGTVPLLYGGNVVNASGTAKTYTLFGTRHSQVGSFAIDLGGETVCPSSPLLIIEELSTATWNRNRTIRGESVGVKAGALMRVTLEETLATPFLCADDYADALSVNGTQYANTCETIFKKYYMGNEDADTQDVADYRASLTNSYTAKIYIDYD